MRKRLEEFQALGAEVVVISFVTPERLKEYQARWRWPFRVLADPQRLAYRAFGLESASWSQLLRPRVIMAYLALMLRGRRPRRAEEDVHQLGGDFVVDASGRVVYAHRSADPADRPHVSDLLAALTARPGSGP